MKIVCVGASQGGGGGATIAMERLAASLRAATAEVRIVALDGPQGRAREFSSDDPRPNRFRRITTHLRRGLRAARSPLTNTLFSVDWPAWDISTHPSVLEADVVNLHWVTGFLNARAVRGVIDSGKPVVWTLHDQRAFTGGCHYAAGCEGFASECEACPQLMGDAREAARRALAATRRSLAAAPLTFVTPSRWLGDELRRSSLFDATHHRHCTIPYDIDVDRFAPRDDKPLLRRSFGLPARGLGIVLGSVSLAETRKGFAEARAAVEQAAAKLRTDDPTAPPPFVVTFGEGSPKIQGVACHHLGRQAEAGVIGILNASDVFLMMTREDNLPNTVMEALACGLPVVGTRVGGVPDMVEDGRQGWLVERDDSAAAATVLVGLARDPGRLDAAATAARSRAVAHYAAPRQARDYLELFAAVQPALRERPPFRPSPSSQPLPMLRMTPATARIVAGRVGQRGVRRRLRRILGRLRTGIRLKPLRSAPRMPPDAP